MPCSLHLSPRCGCRSPSSFGFVAILVLDAVMLMLASRIDDRAIQVSSFGWALVAALVASAATVVLGIVLGTSDDDTHSIRIVRRIARRQGGGATK